jgi:hypothetical protein
MLKKLVFLLVAGITLLTACSIPIAPTINQSDIDDYHLGLLLSDNFEAVKESLAYGEDIDQKIGGLFGERPITEAIDNGRKHILHYLIEQGADLNFKDNDGFTPLMYGTGAYNNLHPLAIYLDPD